MLLRALETKEAVVRMDFVRHEIVGSLIEQ
jgi:hypothetical protein